MPFVLSNMRAALFVTALLAVPAWADECTDDYAECKDGCLIEFGGSMQTAMKKKYEKCANKCTKNARRCSERVMETKNNQLDEGALDGTPASDEADRDGLPTRSGSGGKKKKARDTEDTSSGSTNDDSSGPREALREDEVPRSNRTKLKVDESAAPPKKEEEPKQEDEPAQKSDVIEMKLSKKKKSGGDDELRDDGPRAQPKEEPREDAPPPRRKKKEKTEDSSPKKREEDHDDLRNY